MKSSGRPSKLTEIQKRDIRIMNNAGESQTEISKRFGVSLPTINRICREKK